MGVATLGAEPEIEVEGGGMLDHVAVVPIPAWFIDCLSRIKARDVTEEKVPHNFIAIPRFVSTPDTIARTRPSALSRHIGMAVQRALAILS